jgi:hypothetical protein
VVWQREQRLHCDVSLQPRGRCGEAGRGTLTIHRTSSTKSRWCRRCGEKRFGAGLESVEVDKRVWTKTVEAVEVVGDSDRRNGTSGVWCIGGEWEEDRTRSERRML